MIKLFLGRYSKGTCVVRAKLSSFNAESTDKD